MRLRRVNGAAVKMVVAAEAGEGARCRQPIVPGERVGREQMVWSHRVCIRLRVAVPRLRREKQVSDGWGRGCAGCGVVIVDGEAWVRTGDEVAHRGCQVAS